MSQSGEQFSSFHKRGTLKIFFGYAAGVGKTYAMLEAAHSALEQGVDVVAGYIEPHPRPETAALTEGIEQLPLLSIEYRGMKLNELNVDAALARKPEILLVDELAHTNATGSRNQKRYQDVEEVLQAGISVWTTVNVQHLESLNDLVASITGIVVRERLPDSVFDQADGVELVDIEPHDLVNRLKEGKIYREKQAERALQNFFLPGNLTSLREIALRRMADRVNHRAQEEALSGKNRPPVKEHVLICLSGAPSNARVIRTAARMVEAFHADFTALYVHADDDPGREQRIDPDVQGNAKLAEQLGAMVVSAGGSDIPARIAEYARMSGVSKIVIGRSPIRHGIFKGKPTLVERLSEIAPEIDIYIIPDSNRSGRKHRFGAFSFRRSASLLGKAPTSGRQWGLTLLILALCTGAGWCLNQAGVNDSGITSLYMFGVLSVAAVTTGLWYGFTASIMSILLFDLLFVPPLFSFTVHDISYLANFFFMLISAVFASILTSTSRKHAQKSMKRALYNELLLSGSRKLQRAENEKEILQELCKQLSSILKCHVICYCIEKGSMASPEIYPLQSSGKDEVEQLYNTASKINERSVAQWVAKNGRPAGAGTETLSGSLYRYIPVRGRKEIFAVLGLAAPSGKTTGQFADVVKKNLILALIGECALALEKERLRQANTKIQATIKQEKLRADVLRTISHDLRTPLTSICGNADIISKSAQQLSVEKCRSLAMAIGDDAHYLITMVENILSLSRLEQYKFTLHMEVELVDDVIQEALHIIQSRLGNRTIRTEFSDSIFLAKMNIHLTVQVLVNLLNNAIQYSPDDSTITIKAIADKKFITIEVADEGIGVPCEEKMRVFDMFYTTGSSKVDGKRGMGIGLALCKSIVQAMGGEIGVRDNKKRGSVFYFTLQREDQKQIISSFQE